MLGVLFYKISGIIYKNTKVNKNEILDKLGQDGYFQIIDKDGNVLATINKDTEADENGNVQIGYDGEKTELNFKFSKPLKLGDINILNTKEIKEKMDEQILITDYGRILKNC